ncbi:MAG TPA: PHP domain-containing protein [Actinomycetota bacterium]
MKRYDLHTHSNVSDGALPPAEVVRRAAGAGLDGIALTDHDSTGGLAEARAEGERAGLEVLTGCEISAQLEGKSVHVLGYFMDTEHPRLVEELRWIQDDRVVRAEKMVEKLQKLGVAVTMDMVRAHAEGDSIGRPHVAAAMVDAGVVPTTVDAFTKDWILEGGRAYVDKRVMAPVDTIALIVEAGGVAAVAHPIWVENDLGRSVERIEEWAEAGLGALEVDHPEHEELWRRTYGDLAKRLDLVRTGSSDFHGNAHGGPMGANTTDEDVVAELRARAARR